MPGEGEFQEQQDRRDANEQSLIAGQRSVEQVAVDLHGWQQIGQQRHRPQESKGQREGQRQQPVTRIGRGGGTVGMPGRPRFPVPEALLAAGLAPRKTPANNRIGAMTRSRILSAICVLLIRPAR